MKDLVYIACPVGAATQARVEDNIVRAKRWYRWACDHFPEFAFAANWIVDVEVYAGSDAGSQRHDNPARQLGLDRDDAMIAHCQRFWVCSERLSPGIKRGIETATANAVPVYYFGTLEPPVQRTEPKGNA